MPELVWVHLRPPTELGQHIVFMPKVRWFAGFSRHPIVEELRQLSGEAGRGGVTGGNGRVTEPV